MAVEDRELMSNVSVPVGREEGEVCNRLFDGLTCKGVITLYPTENCSCHIAPPCYQCVSNLPRCSECGWDGSEDKDDEQQ